MADVVVKFSPVSIDDDGDASQKVEAGGDQKSISIEPGDRKSPDLHWVNEHLKCLITDKLR